ncbi:hypothetical protein os1_23580 [Comamonadaceae bacterium OS-1]|nr:hypothetical protein os1_23580 [Comamonadaceae bacterium OS-1]
MDIALKPKLVDVYRRYGFHLVKDNASDGFLVFTIKTGYFDNAEIVKLWDNSDTDNVFNEFTSLGYACTVRLVTSPEVTEAELFRGFFSVDSTRQRLQEDYKKFSGSLVAPYGPTASYTYINAPYQINGKDGVLTVPEEVLSRMDELGPILFLIEAAAGFGKTCTALEIVNLLANDQAHLPLYAELSKNRQARIFRYILLDEIDRSFPLLSSSLVQTEIKNGRVATILDGFDELLRKNDETGAFENKEPMLETVSELLTGRAKVIITTRRTVLFDGDEFHQWLERHAESFAVVRIRIQEPKVSDWLKTDRLTRLTSAGLRMDAMANPVLLSYLRCIDELTFDSAILHPEAIVESYFEYMLERERERQDLRMSVNEQAEILSAIAKNMMAIGYTAEHRDYIVKYLLTDQAKAIDFTRVQYAATDRPSREEIANKLASHALLDRSAQDPNKIGFINEFALGNYVAANILVAKDWMGDDPRFIDPAVRSYSPRSETSRRQLFNSLKESLPFLDATEQIEITSELIHCLPSGLNEAEAEGLNLVDLEIGHELIKSFLFNECTFRRCIFHPVNLDDVTFLNCKIYDCEVSPEVGGGAVYILGGTSFPDISNFLAPIGEQKSSQSLPDPLRLVNQAILKRFWPIGENFNQKPSRPMYKPMDSLCHSNADFTSMELYQCVERLIKQGILFETNKSGMISLRSEFISSAQEILSDAL